MRIVLTNCDMNLKTNFNINMNDLGSYDRLIYEISLILIFNSIEYAYSPIDQIIIDLDEETEIPDLSKLGEVVGNDNYLE